MAGCLFDWKVCLVSVITDEWDGSSGGAGVLKKHLTKGGHKKITEKSQNYHTNPE